MNTATETRPEQIETARPAQGTTSMKAPRQPGDTDRAPRTHRSRRTRGVVVGLVAATAVVGAAGWALAAGESSDSTQTVELTTSQRLVQESIDSALAERVPAGLAEFTTSQRLVQESIDSALAERD